MREAKRNDALGEILPSCDRVRDGKVDGKACTVERDDVTEAEEDHSDGVSPFRTLRPVTERTDDDHKEQGDV